jgi:hypothetical protein
MVKGNSKQMQAISEGTKAVKEMYAFRRIMKLDKDQRTLEDLEFVKSYLLAKTSIAEEQFWKLADKSMRLEICKHANYHMVKPGRVRLMDFAQHVKELCIIVFGQGKGALKDESLVTKLSKLGRPMDLATIREKRKQNKAATIIQARHRGREARRQDTVDPMAAKKRWKVQLH